MDNLLGRQITLTARENTPAGRHRGPGGGRVVQRLDEAARALAGAEITVSPLDAAQQAALLTEACNPDTPAAPEEEGAAA